MLGSILAGGKNAGIDPDGGREKRGLGIPPVQVRIFLFPHWYLVLERLSPTPDNTSEICL